MTMDATSDMSDDTSDGNTSADVGTAVASVCLDNVATEATDSSAVEGGATGSGKCWEGGFATSGAGGFDHQ